MLIQCKQEHVQGFPLLIRSNIQKLYERLKIFNVFLPQKIFIFAKCQRVKVIVNPYLYPEWWLASDDK